MKKIIIKESNLKYPIIFYNNISSSNLLIVFFDGEELIEIFLKYWKQKSIPSFLSISGKNRLNDYSPWKANAINPKYKNFGGNANNLLYTIEKNVNNIIKSNLNLKTCILGFSLGGLISLYSLFVTDIFDICIAISGSYWFPGWINYIKSNSIINNKVNLFILSGINEGINHPYPISKSNVFNKFTNTYFKNKVKNFSSSYDLYSHHYGLEDRMKKSVYYLENYDK